MARATTRQVSFAGLELALQGVQLDPTLTGGHAPDKFRIRLTLIQNAGRTFGAGF